MRIKQPAVAGMFYPDNPVQLAQLINQQLLENPQTGCAPKAILVPHAGLIYSGGIAALAYNRIKPYLSAIKRIVLLGPSHRVPLRGMAVLDADRWHIPLGDIEIDRALTEKVVEFGLAQFNNIAHGQEHCLEVQLPFLKALAGEFQVLPVVVGQTSAEDVASLINYVTTEPDTLVLISSDLSHFHPYDEACDIDQKTMAMISEKRSDIRPEQACGCFALNGLLRHASEHGWQAEQLGYCNSGDTAGGADRVVGYTSYAFY